VDDDDDDEEASSNKKINYEEEPIPASVIGNPNRTVCVITTAALPWRTGTAVNPLLRALYLLRFQNEKKLLLHKEQRKEQGIATPVENDETNAQNRHDNNHGSVALVIPWLESQDDRRKLYGTQNTFSNGPQGMKEQEEWIRSYSSEQCGMPREAKELQIIFYPAFYLAGFGSIFPKVDLCNFIPRELVDVAILEEPEHLNWFRMPNSKEESKRCLSNIMVVDEDDGSEEQSGGDDESKTPSSIGESGVLGQKVEVTINESPSNDIAEVLEKPDAAANVAANTVEDVANENESSQRSSKQQQQLHQANNKKYIEKAKLGWTHRFNFVVGIVHTNYEAYARQYGIGASLIAGPAIGAMSALAIRAYCHEVIKLSDTLPNFAPGKEVTCNVHGVRSEFLEGVDLNVLTSSSTGVGSKLDQQHDVAKKDDNNADDEAPSPVYFIGKLVWAKGFDLMLELQDIFRKRKNNGEYFHIDIYGGGPDEKAIARAFHGRSHPSPTRRPTPPSPSTNKDAIPNTVVADPKDLNAALVLTNPQSIKDQSSQVIEQMKQQQQSRSSLPTTDGGVEDVVAQYLSLGFEVSQMNGSATYFQESRRRLVEGEDDRSTSAPSASLSSSNKNAKNPLDILGDLSGKSFDTGVKTSQAVYNIADSSIKNILTMSFSQLKHPLKHRRNKKDKEAAVKQGEKTLEGEEDKQQQPHFVFDPPVSRYEWRRHPIPAKFPGVIDHAQLKNIAHKIFLNPSTSEVLCTTTAEALAMNKFVIIPKHPSNDFFVQFTNCLSYDTLEECADKMAWALENTPAPLSEEERRKFTWEAATERLMESSIVTVKQARERAENGMDKTDARIAYWLSESGEKSNMIRNLFHKNGGGGSGDHLPLVDLGVIL